jgi:hypothetical protein
MEGLEEIPTPLHAPALTVLSRPPFLQATPGPPPLHAASYVRRGAIQFSHMSRTHPQLSSTTANLPGQNSLINPSDPLTTVTYASIGTSRATVRIATTPRASAFTSALSVVKLTQHSPGHAAAAPPTLEEFLLVAQPPHLQYPDFTDSIVPRPFFDPIIHLHQEIFDRIHHPYNTDAFESSLIKFNLMDRYPRLVHNLRHGFPLGNMPPLIHTVILSNHPSCIEYSLAINEYLAAEVASLRMSGPFSHEDIGCILRGPFQSSPLIVSVQPQHPGEPDKIRICRHLSKAS